MQPKPKSMISSKRCRKRQMQNYRPQIKIKGSIKESCILSFDQKYFKLYAIVCHEILIRVILYFLNTNKFLL